MKVYCVFSLESLQLGDSNEYTQFTISHYEKKTILNCTKSAAMGFVLRDPRMSSKKAVVSKPSVFEPLKFYCFARKLKSEILFHSYDYVLLLQRVYLE